MTTAEILSYYADQLIVQFRGKPKATAHVKAVASELVADQLYTKVRDSFDLDVAAGDQLHVLGKYTGTPEVIYTLNPSKKFMDFPTYADANASTSQGFANYSDFEDDILDLFLSYSDISDVGYELNDEEFRNLTKFLAAVNGSTLGVGEIDAILLETFGVVVTMIDNGDMTVTFNQDPSDTSSLFAIAKAANAFPRPAGVSLLYTNV